MQSIRSSDAQQETQIVTRDNNALLSPEVINLDEANRVKLQAVLGVEGAA